MKKTKSAAEEVELTMRCATMREPTSRPELCKDCRQWELTPTTSITHNNEVLDEVQQVEGSDDLELQRLVLGNGLTVAICLMSLASKVLDSVIVQQTVGMNAAGDLKPRNVSWAGARNAVIHARCPARSSRAGAWFSSS